MTTGERMRARRKELDIPAQTIANALNITTGTLYRYEKGDIEKVPGSILPTLAKLLQCTPAYLMGWEEDSSQPTLPGNCIPPPKMVKVPLLGTIACGEPILAEENLDGSVEAPENVRCDFALHCKGDSMIGAHIMDGDVVYIRQQPDVEDGEIAAVLIGDEATLKRVYKIPGRVQLRPENPAFPVLEYSGQQLEEMRILGKAVGFTHRF